jgi:hypothetical protein
MAPAGCIWAASPPTPPANGRRSRPATSLSLISLILGERVEDTKFLIRDRGSNFTASFDADFRASGTRTLRTAVQAPRMNAICERLAGTLRGELLDRDLIISEQHLRAVLTEYQSHYNTARLHQGIAQRVPDDEPDGSPPHRDRSRHPADPPKTCPQRPHQRVRTPPEGRNTFRQPGESNFRAVQDHAGRWAGNPPRMPQRVKKKLNQ